MRDFFAVIYETVFGLYNSDYNLIYRSMFEEQGYNTIGLVFILVPLVLMGLFYFAYWYPYGKAWHWGIAVAVGIIIIGGLTYHFFNVQILATNNPNLAEALYRPNTNYLQHAHELRTSYIIVNCLLGAVCSVLYSLIFKQFSKLHGHLPV